jgi:hypothetical protein
MLNLLLCVVSLGLTKLEAKTYGDAIRESRANLAKKQPKKEPVTLCTEEENKDPAKVDECEERRIEYINREADAHSGIIE